MSPEGNSGFANRRLRCPVDGCVNDIPHYHLMCARHWYQLPRDQRNEVWRAWQAFLEGREEAALWHSEVKKAAIDYVNALEAARSD